MIDSLGTVHKLTKITISISLISSPVVGDAFTEKKSMMQKKEKYESPNPRRTHTLMSQEDVQAGKKSSWYELEITGTEMFTFA